jgi:putative redox protein
MADDALRHITLRRAGSGRYVAVNDRGGELTFGSGAGPTAFTPVDLLLVALAGCSAVDVDTLTTRRAEPQRFDVQATARKVRTEDGNRLQDVELTFRVVFPDGKDGDAARVMLPRSVAMSHDRLCTVSRTVELGTPVAVRIEE